MAIVAAVVGAARTIAAAGGVIGNITGSAPKDFAKFNRALGPLMKAQAQVTGVSTFAYWHDDVVAMDGQTLNFRIVGSPGSLNLAEIVFRQEAERLGRIWVFRCQSNTDFKFGGFYERNMFFFRILEPRVLRVRRIIAGSPVMIQVRILVWVPALALALLRLASWVA